MKLNKGIVIVVILAVIAAAGYVGWRHFGAPKVSEAVAGANISAPAAKGSGVDITGEKLMQVGPLGEMSLGDRNAPVTVIEYASLTCSHCAEFHKDDYPKLKSQYIDTGKVFFVFRDFPFDPVATAGFMLAHCSGPERYFGFTDVLFDNQEKWAYAKEPMVELRRIALQGGFTDETFKACLQNQKVLDGIRWAAERGNKEFGVNATPTFFINGEKSEGALPWAEFEALLQKHLKDAGAK